MWKHLVFPRNTSTNIEVSQFSRQVAWARVVKNTRGKVAQQMWRRNFNLNHGQVDFLIIDTVYLNILQPFWFVHEGEGPKSLSDSPGHMEIH